MRRRDHDYLGGLANAAGNGDDGLDQGILTTFAGTSWHFAGNAASHSDRQYWGNYPAGDSYTEKISALGLAADGSLSSASPFRNRATDPGPNVSEVLRRTSGVVVSP